MESLTCHTRMEEASRRRRKKAMQPRLWLACAVLSALLLLSLASLTAASESPLGGLAAGQTRRAASRLQADAALLWKSSRQDGSFAVALWNNAEGLGLCRAAQHLLLQAGLPVPPGLLDLAAALQEDRDELAEKLPEAMQP